MLNENRWIQSILHPCAVKINCLHVNYIKYFQCVELTIFKYRDFNGCQEHNINYQHWESMFLTDKSLDAGAPGHDFRLICAWATASKIPLVFSPWSQDEALASLNKECQQSLSFVSCTQLSPWPPAAGNARILSRAGNTVARKKMEMELSRQDIDSRSMAKCLYLKEQEMESWVYYLIHKASFS